MADKTIKQQKTCEWPTESQLYNDYHDKELARQ